HQPRLLARHAQRFAARGEDADARAALEQGVRDFGTGVYQVLAVVEDEEGLALAQPVHHGLDRRPASLFTIAQRRGDQLGHERWIRVAGEVLPGAALEP